MTGEAALFHAALQDLDIGIIILCQDKKIRVWNLWMEQHSGLASESTQEKSIYGIFPQLESSRIDLAIDDTLQFGTSAILSNALNYHTFPLYKIDDHETPIEQMLLLKSLDSDGKRYCMIEIFDVSNAVTREALLRKKALEAEQGLAVAENLSRIKSEFVSTVSHELRTPLTAIKAAIDLIRYKIPAEARLHVESMIDIAARNTQRLLNLINDLLDMEKIEAGKMEYHFQFLDIAPILQQVVLDTEQFALTHDVKLQLDMRKQDDFAVYGDEKRLSQVFVNLLSNAIKFSPPGSSVIIRCRVHERVGEVSIIDHGPGIQPDKHDYIFDKFTQVDSSDTRKVPGTGLGLSISRAIVQNHHGTLDFESQPQVETRFYVHLPIVEQA